MSHGAILQRARNLNRLLVAMTDPHEREAFARSPVAVMEQFALSPVECEMLQRRDWQRMLEHGASIYAIAKGCRAFGLSLMDVGAAMRGLSARELRERLPFHALSEDHGRG